MLDTFLDCWVYDMLRYFPSDRFDDIRGMSAPNKDITDNLV